MSLTSVLDRLKQQLYPFITQNAVSDAMLRGPADALSQLEAAADVLEHDGRWLEPNTVTIQSDLITVTQVASVERIGADGSPVLASLVDWTTKFKVNDEIVIGGSALGNNGRRKIATVSAGSLTIVNNPGAGNNPFVAAESGLLYAKPTAMLKRLCRELLLYPGGYETDTQLRTLLGDWVTTMQLRGSRSGVVAEMNRATNSTTALLETIPDLTTLGTAVSYTHSSTKAFSAASWYTTVSLGSNISVGGSVKGSNGRYTVYGISGTNVQVGHRAGHATSYVRPTVTGVKELQIKEDRNVGQLRVRLANTLGSSANVQFTLTVTAGTISGTVRVTEGTGTVGTVTSTSAQVTLNTTSGSVATPTYAEVLIPLATPVASTTAFAIAVNSGSPTNVRLGEMGLCPMAADGTANLSGLWPWKWGGIVFTGLRSQASETGLKVYALTKPGFYVGVSSPDSVEEDAYTMASPDEFVVLEVDHRNSANYTKQDLEALVRDVLLPADVDGVLGLL